VAPPLVSISNSKPPGFKLELRLAPQQLRLRKGCPKLWKETVTLTQAKRSSWPKSAPATGVTVQLLRGDTVAASESITIVTNQVPRFAIGINEKLRFEFD